MLGLIFKYEFKESEFESISYSIVRVAYVNNC